MSYIPAAYRKVSLAQGSLISLSQAVQQAEIVRGVKCVSFSYERAEKSLLLGLEGLETQIILSADRRMQFGTESITMIEYFRRVVEKDDFLDFILDPDYSPQTSYFWIHIEYIGTRPPNLKFSQKDDGLFALRTKAGEKAERLVTKHLIENYHHQYPTNLLEGTGTFQIWYERKKQRAPDRICTYCGLHIEVKKRNKDELFRISHSEQRPFWMENQISGWHAFVFPDMKIHFVSNQQIIHLLEAKHFVSGGDRYDKWADLDKSCVEEEPPNCQPP